MESLARGERAHQEVREAGVRPDVSYSADERAPDGFRSDTPRWHREHSRHEVATCCCHRQHLAACRRMELGALGQLRHRWAINDAGHDLPSAGAHRQHSDAAITSVLGR